jgi:TfoX/Sxy family transcriptional regulator of competence genes
VAYDERLADRVRAALADQPGISERKMFGGIAFLLDGKMCVGVLNDELVVRSGKERFDATLKEKHTRPMDFTGRVSTGMVYVSSAGVTRGAALQRWVDIGLAGARTAPSSARRRSTRASPKRS